MGAYVVAIISGIAMYLFLDILTPLDGWSTTIIAAGSAIIVGIIADENTDPSE